MAWDSTVLLLCLAAHGLLTGGNHNEHLLGVKARMREPTTKLTTFLAKSTRMAEEVSCKVTNWLTLLALHLILNKASTAPTRSVERLAAPLEIELSTDSSTAGICKAGRHTVRAKEGLANQVETTVMQAVIGKSPGSRAKSLSIAPVEHTWDHAT